MPIEYHKRDGGVSPQREDQIGPVHFTVQQDSCEASGVESKLIVHIWLTRVRFWQMQRHSVEFGI
jgi:hypothetical protein